MACTKIFFTNSFTLNYTKLLWNINIKYTISEETVMTNMVETTTETIPELHFHQHLKAKVK